MFAWYQFSREGGAEGLRRAYFHWPLASRLERAHLYIATVAQTSKSAVSRVSKPAGHRNAQPSRLEIGDTAGLETRATKLNSSRWVAVSRCAWRERRRRKTTGVLRGGSWNNDHPDNPLSSYRNSNPPDNRNGNIGFRVVRVRTP